MKKIFGFFLLASVAACAPGDKEEAGTWPTYGHDATNNKFSALTYIDTANVSQLKEAWRFEDTTEGGIYFNPVMMKDKMIGLMPSNKMVEKLL